LFLAPVQGLEEQPRVLHQTGALALARSLVVPIPALERAGRERWVFELLVVGAGLGAGGARLRGEDAGGRPQREPS
jgi:hypothetical protein